MPTNEFLVQLCGFFGKDAGFDLNSGMPQSLETASRNKRIRVLDRTNNALDARLDQSLGTGRRFTVMIVRFKRNISRSSAGVFAGLLERNGFGMNCVVFNITAFADNTAVARNYHTSDKRVG